MNERTRHTLSWVVLIALAALVVVVALWSPALGVIVVGLGVLYLSKDSIRGSVNAWSLRRERVRELKRKRAEAVAATTVVTGTTGTRVVDTRQEVHPPNLFGAVVGFLVGLIVGAAVWYGIMMIPAPTSTPSFEVAKTIFASLFAVGVVVICTMFGHASISKK